MSLLLEATESYLSRLDLNVYTVGFGLFLVWACFVLLRFIGSYIVHGLALFRLARRWGKNVLVAMSLSLNWWLSPLVAFTMILYLPVIFLSLTVSEGVREWYTVVYGTFVSVVIMRIMVKRYPYHDDTVSRLLTCATTKRKRCT